MVRNDEIRGDEPGSEPGREPGRARGSERAEPVRQGEPEEPTYPHRTEEGHVAGAREPVEKESVEPVEPEGGRMEDRSRMSDIMKRVNDALHRVRPKEDRER